MAKTIHDISLLNLLPDVIANDDFFKHVAAAVDIELREVTKTISKAAVLCRIDDVEDEDIVDHLAYRFSLSKSEGYLFADNIDAKKQLIKSSIPMHRKKGTPGAVKNVFKILGLKAHLTEWFEFGGEPYTFRVVVDLFDRGLNKETFAALEEMIDEYKNKRSHLDQLDIFLSGQGVINYNTCLQSGEIVTVYPYASVNLEQSESIYYGIGTYCKEETIIYPEVING